MVSSLLAGIPFSSLSVEGGMPWLLTRGERRRRNRLQGGRLHLGTVAGIKSERWPTSSRNRWPACVGIRKQATGIQPAVLVATELSRASWLLAVYDPTTDKISRCRIAGGDDACLIGVIGEAQRRAEHRPAARSVPSACSRRAMMASGFTAASRRRGSAVG